MANDAREVFMVANANEPPDVFILDLKISEHSKPKEVFMLVKGWMTTDVITASEDTSMMKASIIMKANNIRCLPVLKNGRLVGLVTDRDLKEAAPSRATTLDVHEVNYLLSHLALKDLMTKAIVYVRPDETMELAAVLMLENKIHSLPVVNDHEKLVGIITQTDIFKALINTTGVYSANLQFAFSLPDEPGSIRAVTDVIRSFGARVASILSSRDLAEEGTHNVFIRIQDMEETNLRRLIEALEKNFMVLYTVRDLLDSVGNRSTRMTR